MTDLDKVLQTDEYNVISTFYGTRKAERSQVPLMNHIHEGIDILVEQQASTNAILAFCLHPIVQNDEDIDVSWSPAYLLALEYKARANSYLCRPETDYIKTVDDVSEVVGPMSIDCLLMLLADKRQNQKDFIKYHRQTHTRTRELERYFNLWLSYIHKELSKHER